MYFSVFIERNVMMIGKAEHIKLKIRHLRQVWCLKWHFLDDDEVVPPEHKVGDISSVVELYILS